MSTKTKDLGLIILEAFEGEGNELRSLGGISRAINLPKEKVESYLNAHPDLFRKADIAPSGIVFIKKLIRLRKTSKKIKKASPLDLWLYDSCPTREGSIIEI